ncbi:sensor histidine kinase [Clostridium ihumii]|uniref:sensor histidine kinase n=1 Tax=Clostridium ihumii TaxID=1470356 RepID=UPI00058B3E1C|nr:HAMP domain-containing sensor histidine kinase [Clostridium ihumii]
MEQKCYRGVKCKMKYTYKNNYLKFNLLWSIVVALLMIILNISIDISFEKIKQNYINESYAIIGSFYNRQAMEEDTIAKIFTQGAKYGDCEKGKQILSSYGYKENMDIKLLPNINKSYKTLKLHINALVISSMFILYLIVLIFYKKIVSYIKMINKGIKNVVEGDFSLRFSFMGEGVFSVLSHNFNQMAERLENAINQLNKEKVFLKDTLVNISHQLKTPITSMSLFTEVLSNNSSMDKGDVEKIAYKMRSSVYSMEWLIRKLLKLAKIEGGVVEYKKINSSLKETIENALEPLLISIEEKNLNLQLKLQEGVYPHDKGWTSEALTNIIKNSIEHISDYGEISICYENNSIYHKISISDNGTGINKEDLPHIFERFYKGKSKIKRKDSIGIGLALSKSIIEGQGGFLEVESIKDKGSKFIVTFLTNL